MFATPLEEKVRALIEPPLDSLGYALVQLKLRDGRPRALEIMAERRDGGRMGLDDCTLLSRQLSALLDVEDPISGAYQLEVCSPGLDRPLNGRADFERFAGQEAKVEIGLPLEGRKRFRGVIGASDENEVALHMPEGSVRLAFANIRHARLVPPDVLGKKEKR